ncbi:MAG: hypothetical protein DHS20C02_02880 [Micavibrio sp.]|nr:MAG: hypothetical protein DHS20C02_02880 [Micavibrio sp.]
MLSPDFFQHFFTGLKSGSAFNRVLYTVLGSAAVSVLFISAVTHIASAQEDPGVMNLLPDGEREGGSMAEEVEGGISAPSASALSSPQAGSTPESGAVEIPSIEAPDDVDDNVFFDAEALVPTGEMGTGAPRKVNPRLQPASKLILVTKNAGSNSRKAQLVSASRAMKLGRYEAALDMYDRLYAKNKRDPRILMGRAVSLQHLGRFDAAIGTYEELSEVDPHNVEAKINMLGLLGTKYPSVALRRLLDLRDEHANNPGIAAQIAVTQAKLGNFEEAIHYLGIAASMEPDNAGHVYNMAVIADRAGSKKQAVKYYEQALEIDSIYGRGETIPRESVYERLANIR